MNAVTQRRVKIRFLALSKLRRSQFLSCTTLLPNQTIRKVRRSTTSLVCKYCNDLNAVGVMRFRVEFLVDDGSGVARFVVFDREMTKLVNAKAADIIESKVNDNDDAKGCDDIPKCINVIIGKNMTFQIKVTAYNFSSRHQSFTVSRVFEDGHGQTTVTKVTQIIFSYYILENRYCDHYESGDGSCIFLLHEFGV